LKQELGFEDFLISDYNAIDQIDRYYKKAIGISINAGMDMAMVPSRYKEYEADLGFRRAAALHRRGRPRATRCRYICFSPA
jgi:beta-glucosidase-like glycosyl hydrolase